MIIAIIVGVLVFFLMFAVGKIGGSIFEVVLDLFGDNFLVFLIIILAIIGLVCLV